MLSAKQLRTKHNLFTLNGHRDFRFAIISPLILCASMGRWGLGFAGPHWPRFGQDHPLLELLHLMHQALKFEVFMVHKFVCSGPANFVIAVREIRTSTCAHPKP